MSIKFKDTRLEKEYFELMKRNVRLYQVVEMVARYAEVELGKEITVTCVYRSPEENAAVNGIPNSPHLVWNAVDLRSRDFTDAEIQKLLALLNCVTYRPGKLTSICHAVPGGAYHFHIQVLKPGEK